MRPDFTNDIEGTKWFAEYLKKHGFTNVNDMHDNHRSWDLEAEWKGKKFYFECKMRKIDSKTWGDSICEMYKLKCVPDINHAYLINFFTDCFTIIPLNSEYEIQHKLCQTSEWWDRTKIEKDLVSFKNLPKYCKNYE